MSDHPHPNSKYRRMIAAMLASPTPARTLDSWAAEFGVNRELVSRASTECGVATERKSLPAANVIAVTRNPRKFGISSSAHIGAAAMRGAGFSECRKLRQIVSPGRIVLEAVKES